MSNRANFDPIQLVAAMVQSGQYALPLSTVTAATYTVEDGDVILNITRTATGTCAISLPTKDHQVGRVLLVKDAGGGATTYNITVTTEGSETIDGAASVVIDANYSALWLYTDGSNWFVF